MSCNKPNDNPDITKKDWGKTKYYKEFPFCPYEPDTLEKKLMFEFNETALDSLTEDIELIVVRGKEILTQDTVYCEYESEAAKDIILFKERVLCEDNILKINKAESGKTITLRIVLPAGGTYADETIHLGLRVKNAGGLDYIDNIDLEKEKQLSHEWTIKKDKVWNPLGFLLFWAMVVIVVILLACYIIAHFFINPSTKFSKVFVDYNDGAGEQRINMGSAYKLLCTNKKTKFSIFSKFFVGVVKVEVNDFWTSPLTIKSGTRNNIRLSGTANYELDNDETVRKEPFTITNENGQKATITTA
jgi:hypothetical protein